MSRRIAHLLDKPEKEITKVLARLEDKNGYPSHDARHLAENIQAVRRKVIDLGLDPDDTTAQELYHALLAKFEADSLSFDVANHFHAADFAAKAAKAAELVTKDSELPQRWVLKTTAAKNLLRSHQPKHLMKQLSYRSAESMLKRENIGELLIRANFSESASWKKELSRLVAKQDSTAFEVRAISLINIDDADADTEAPLVYNDDIGALALVRNKASELMKLLSLCIVLDDFLASLSDSAHKFISSDETLNWWQEAEHLLAVQDGQAVSLNIKDAGLNHSRTHDFAERLMGAGRTAFWKHLLSRYENQLAIEEDLLLDEMAQILPARIPIRQPAFEYAEDF
jgi:hypothetical protein